MVKVNKMIFLRFVFILHPIQFFQFLLNTHLHSTFAPNTVACWRWAKFFTPFQSSIEERVAAMWNICLVKNYYSVSEKNFCHFRSVGFAFAYIDFGLFEHSFFRENCLVPCVPFDIDVIVWVNPCWIFSKFQQAAFKMNYIILAKFYMSNLTNIKMITVIEIEELCLSYRILSVCIILLYNIFVDINGIFTKLVSGNDLRGYGGELLRKGACKLMEKMALSSIPVHETGVLDACWNIIFTTVPHAEPAVQVQYPWRDIKKRVYIKWSLELFSYACNARVYVPTCKISSCWVIRTKITQKLFLCDSIENKKSPWGTGLFYTRVWWRKCCIVCARKRSIVLFPVSLS